MAPERYCVNCGEPLAEGAVFCPSCGHRVNDAPQEGAPPEATAPAVAPVTPPAPRGVRPAADDGGGKKTIYWIAGGGCGLILLAIIGVVAWLVLSGNLAEGLSGLLAEPTPTVAPTDAPIASATPTRSPEPTQTLAPTATATAQPSVTPTREPTEAPQPEATVAPPDTGEPDGPPTRGALLYSEDFQDASSGWDVYSEEGSSVAYEGGQYVVRVDQETWYAGGNAYQWFDQDIAIVVEATKIDGPDNNSFGIVFGSQGLEDFYWFEVASDGYYHVVKMAEGEWTEMIPWAETDLVRPGEAMNRLVVEVRGDRLAFLVNGELLDVVEDPSFAGGDVGLSAGSFEEGGVAIAFDNLRVHAIEGLPATPIPASRLGELLYSEDFSDASTGWDEFVDAGMYLAYEEGQYVIRVDSPNWMSWGNAYQRFEDGIIIRVKATKVGGPDDNCYGVVFGYQDSDNFYRFEIASDGYFRFGKYVDDEWIPIVPWTESDLILQGYETNVIRVEMRDGRFVFAVNGEPLAWAQDDSFANGDVGLVAGSFDIPGVEIAFDDFEVYAADDIVAQPEQPATGTLLFADGFEYAENGWDVFSGDDQTVGYEDGQYVLRVNKANWMTWGNAYQWFEDGILIEVDATKLDGPDDNGYGLVFGYQDENNFYRFEISTDGYYRFGKYVDNEWIELIPWTTSELILQGEATNRVSAAMRGGRLVFAVNGEVLTATEDDSFSDGDVGLVAGSFDEAGMVIGFDDFVVYAMP